MKTTSKVYLLETILFIVIETVVSVELINGILNDLSTKEIIFPVIIFTMFLAMIVCYSRKFIASLKK